MTNEVLAAIDRIFGGRKRDSWEYLAAVRLAGEVLEISRLGAAVSASQNIEKFREVWPTINRFRGQLIDRNVSGRLEKSDKELLDALQTFADWYLETTVPRDTSVLEKLEAVSASSQPEKLAQLFHETYERLAPQFGYETRKESAKAWLDIPPNNRRLMIAVCAEMSQFFAAAPAQEPDSRLLEDCALLLRRCVGKLKRGDKKFADTVTDFLGCKGLTSNLLRESAAHEQPVENSRSQWPGCSEIENHRIHHGVREEFGGHSFTNSPQKGKP